MLTVNQAVLWVGQRRQKVLYANHDLGVFKRLMLSRQLSGYTPICRYSADFLAAMIQPNEFAHYKEIVAMDVIAKRFNPINLASVAQDIWEHCHA